MNPWRARYPIRPLVKTSGRLGGDDCVPHAVWGLSDSVEVAATPEASREGDQISDDNLGGDRW